LASLIRRSRIIPESSALSLLRLTSLCPHTLTPSYRILGHNYPVTREMCATYVLRWKTGTSYWPQRSIERHYKEYKELTKQRKVGEVKSDIPAACILNRVSI
jgi:hypothetical protein